MLAASLQYLAANKCLYFNLRAYCGLQQLKSHTTTLAQEAKEPEIYKAIRFGTILENVVFDRRTRVVDFSR